MDAATYDVYANDAHPNGFIIERRGEPTSHWHGTFGGLNRAKSLIKDFKSNPLGWDKDALSHHGNRKGELLYSSESEELDEYKTKYFDLVRALEAEAVRRRWCDEWDTFKAKHNIEDLAPVLPAEPAERATIVKFDGLVPVARDTDGRWHLVTLPKVSYAWDELFNKYNLHGKDFDILHTE